MQGANKTINTKVGLDLPMSEQGRQRQVTLNEGYIMRIYYLDILCGYIICGYIMWIYYG